MQFSIVCKKCLSLSTALAFAAWACVAAKEAAAATLADLIAGATVETEWLTFDSFSYTGFAGGPTAADVLVTAVAEPGGWQGLRFEGAFQASGFVNASLGYRVALNTVGEIEAASMQGNPTADMNCIVSVSEVLSQTSGSFSIWGRSGLSSPSATRNLSTSAASRNVSTTFSFSAFTPGVASVSALTQSFRVLNADFDGDDVVGGEDLADWAASFGAVASALHAQGNADMDADVDGRDFLVWQRQQGQDPQAAAPTATIPEPACHLLAACGLGFLARRSRQRRLATRCTHRARQTVSRAGHGR